MPRWASSFGPPLGVGASQLALINVRARISRATPKIALRMPNFIRVRFSLGKREQPPRLAAVAVHLRDQCLRAVELRFGADVVMKRDLDLAAVEIAVEVEQMRF